MRKKLTSKLDIKDEADIFQRVCWGESLSQMIIQLV